jgi:hypothetical protein
MLQLTIHHMIEDIMLEKEKKVLTTRRQEIGRMGAMAREDKKHGVPQATHGAPDKPLKIGDIEIGCYVLNNGVRVVTQKEMIKGVGLSVGRGKTEDAVDSDGIGELPTFISQNWIKPFLSNDLTASVRTPIKFRHPNGGTLAHGYPATVLVDICESVLSARKAGALQKRQEPIADRCETLMRGFARVGIIALVDEATGYQEKRDKDELHKILSLYLSEERLAWAKRFPDEYYKNLYRLRGWSYPSAKGHTPLVGKLTNQLVYEKLPEGVLTELRHKNPIDPDTGSRKHKHHQFLSEGVGVPGLRDHMLQLVAIMRAEDNWDEFERKFQRVFPGAAIDVNDE